MASKSMGARFRTDRAAPLSRSVWLGAGGGGGSGGGLGTALGRKSSWSSGAVWAATQSGMDSFQTKSSALTSPLRMRSRSRSRGMGPTWPDSGAAYHSTSAAGPSGSLSDVRASTKAGLGTGAMEPAREVVAGRPAVVGLGMGPVRGAGAAGPGPPISGSRTAMTFSQTLHRIFRTRLRTFSSAMV